MKIKIITSMIVVGISCVIVGATTSPTCANYSSSTCQPTQFSSTTTTNNGHVMTRTIAIWAGPTQNKCISGNAYNSCNEYTANACAFQETIVDYIDNVQSSGTNFFVTNSMSVVSIGMPCENNNTSN